MKTVSFGARTVKADEKAGLVRGVFDSVAPHYDLMNDLMSCGLHRVWKSVLLDRLNPQPGQLLVDVAGGTGDIAIGFLERAAGRPLRGRKEARAVVCDINHAMLREALERPALLQFARTLSHVCGSAEALPLEEGSCDRYTIGFGIRNVTDRQRALAEAHRVLRPGGRFVCLEFSRPTTPLLESAYRRYSDNVIPALGERVARDRDSYVYLVESIRRFPSQNAFAQEIRQAGFKRVAVENLTGGVVALHSGWKI
jgi:demethylmenaquinone methyltransferase/2-methoxy-6-polyprenyl-1,4-benzoquinol methylase